MYRRAFTLLSLLLVVALQFAGGSVVAQDGLSVTPTDELSPTVDHPLVPLAIVPSKIFTGEEFDEETGERIAIRVEETVLPRPAQVAGMDVTVVAVDDYHNGEFVKSTEDYFAQAPDGTVHYVGERVDEYEDGQIVGHEGAWLAGDNGAQPGVFMLADPDVGETFVLEHVPGIAQERTTVIAVDQTVTVPAGTFAGCIVAEDASLLEGTTEKKTHCPEVGLVREDAPGSRLELVQFTTTS